MSVIPDTARKIKQEDLVQACLSKKQDLISKITRAKRARGVTEVVENLLSKHEAQSLLDLDPSAPLKNEK
jgi:hypothetical protein